MYSSTIQFKELTLKIGRQTELYHQVTVYDHITAHAQLAFVLIDTEVMIDYLSARKLRHAKGTLTSGVLQYTSAAVPYSTLLDRILRS